jgi:hypothetical protein
MLKKVIKRPRAKRRKKKMALINSNENNQHQRSLRKKIKLGVRNFESRGSVEN